MVKFLTAAAIVAGTSLGGSFLPAASAAELASPTVTSAQFVGAPPSECVTPPSAISYISREEKMAGSRLLILTDGVQQGFADAWRWRFNVASVPVALVLARFYDTARKGGHMVETIEFDERGCAMTRTTMPAEDFMSLMQSINAIAA